jgi:hypothetical protein
MRELESAGVSTLAQVGTLPVPLQFVPRRGAVKGAITSHSSDWQRDANFDEPHRRADRQTNTGDY